MPDTKTDSSPQPIDWKSLWDALEWDDEGRRQLAMQEQLRQRARQYARPLYRDDVEADEEKITILTFDLGAERYGMDVTAVRGIRMVGSIARVPGTPHFYRGVTNVRGQIITVLDLLRFFDLDMDPDHLPKELILVKSNELELGLLADHVEGVMTIPHIAIEAADFDYAHGITMGRLVVLDVEALFTDEKLIMGRIANG